MIDAFYFQKLKCTCPKQNGALNFSKLKTLNPFISRFWNPKSKKWWHKWS